MGRNKCMHSLTRFIHLHSHPSMHRCANVKHTRLSASFCLKSLTRGQTLTQMHGDFPWCIGLECRSGSEQGANSYYGGYQTELLVAAVRHGGLVSNSRAGPDASSGKLRSGMTVCLALHSKRPLLIMWDGAGEYGRKPWPDINPVAFLHHD